MISVPETLRYFAREEGRGYRDPPESGPWCPASAGLTCSSGFCKGAPPPKKKSLKLVGTGAFPDGPVIKLEKEMATHSSILAGRIPWTEEPGRP